MTATAKPKRARKPKAQGDQKAGVQTVLVLRTCNADMSSAHGKFVWPSSGPVEAPDWDPKPRCGKGLHGLLWGVGDAGLLDWWSPDARGLVVEVEQSTIVDLGGKVKFPRGNVVFVGDVKSAAQYLQQRAPAGIGAIVAGTATAGYAGTATAGYAGTATAGVRGTATAGFAGTATAGVRGTATAGYAGTATAGYAGTATAGDAGTATAGVRGTATAGYAGAIAIQWWDPVQQRYRVKVGEVGENGIKPNVAYRVQDGQFVEAEPEYLEGLRSNREAYR